LALARDIHIVVVHVAPAGGREGTAVMLYLLLAAVSTVEWLLLVAYMHVNSTPPLVLICPLLTRPHTARTLGSDTR
jgi:hypothetical protein